MSGDRAASTAYLAVGANRQTAAADWSDEGTLCFGAGVNIAVWRPSDASSKGITSLLSGHEKVVKAIQFLPGPAPNDGREKYNRYLISGGDDQALKLWSIDGEAGTGRCVQTVKGAHAAPINCIAAPKPSRLIKSKRGTTLSRRLFATGGADATIKIWELVGEESGTQDGASHIVLLQTIKTSPRYFPLCLALVSLDDVPVADRVKSPEWMLAAAGTGNRIQIFVGTSNPETDAPLQFALQASLTGHEGWIRSLDFGRESTAGDILLASASQDKYVRLWRIHRGSSMPVPSASAAAASAADTLSDYLPGKSPSNKAHKLRAGDVDYSVTFEALLLGHEDWIYSAKWDAAAATDYHSSSDSGPAQERRSLRLLTASADNSLAVWEADATSGIWVTTARLGELSKEKGATTATGSVGGFWTGLWSPSGQSVVTLCRTGSWRRWNHDPADDRWVQAVGISGHVEPVTGVAWSRNGAYLLSTGGDQTTRLHAEWKTNPSSASSFPTWHELARPQIHGYDLNCIDTLGASQFVSGADEKLMRVFHEPKTVARLLERLSGSAPDPQVSIDALPDAANMPVLGLSNKAVDAEDIDGGGNEGIRNGTATVGPSEQDKAADAAAAAAAADGAVSLAAADHPPFEDVLSRSTLWPETEKLYGHGYEISCLAVSHDGRLVASACRASSLNHAVVRLFETAPRWTEVKPPLATHTLTVTRLRFSADDRLLLSVGRDRQWAVFERQDEAGRAANGDGQQHSSSSTSVTYKLRQANAKAHSRMILDCAWAPLDGVVRGAASPGALPTRAFATAGRDKNVKLWTTARASSSTNENKDLSVAPSADNGFTLRTTIPRDHPVTAVDFLWPRTGLAGGSSNGSLVLAVGTEGGKLSIISWDTENWLVSWVWALDAGFCLPKAVLQFAWRPPQEQEVSGAADTTGVDLAVAGEDGSLRVYRFQGL